MIALTLSNIQILLIVALAASLMISAFRMAKMARHYDRSPKAWFFISLFFTAIPATIVFWHDRTRSVSAGYAQQGQEESDTPAPAKGRCPHCGAILDAGDQENGECPHCHMALDEGHYA